MIAVGVSGGSSVMPARISEETAQRTRVEVVLKRAEADEQSEDKRPNIVSERRLRKPSHSGAAASKANHVEVCDRGAEEGDARCSRCPSPARQRKQEAEEKNAEQQGSAENASNEPDSGARNSETPSLTPFLGIEGRGRTPRRVNRATGTRFRRCWRSCGGGR